MSTPAKARFCGLRDAGILPKSAPCGLKTCTDPPAAVDPAFRADRETVASSIDFAVRDGQIFILSEIATIAQGSVFLDIEGEHIFALSIVDIEDFLVRAQRDAIRKLDSVRDFDHLAA